MLSFSIILHRSLLLCHASCDKLCCNWPLKMNSNASNETWKPSISWGLCKCANRHRMSKYPSHRRGQRAGAKQSVRGQDWPSRATDSKYKSFPKLHISWHEISHCNLITKQFLSNIDFSPHAFAVFRRPQCNGEACVQSITTILMFLLTLAGGPIILWSHTEQWNDNNSTPGSEDLHSAFISTFSQESSYTPWILYVYTVFCVVQLLQYKIVVIMAVDLSKFVNIRRSCSK